jgi:hypothetical protein
MGNVGTILAQNDISGRGSFDFAVGRTPGGAENVASGGSVSDRYVLWALRSRLPGAAEESRSGDEVSGYRKTL